MFQNGPFPCRRFWWRLPQLTSDYTRDWSLISHKPHRETNDHSHSQSYDHQEGELSLRQATPMSAAKKHTYLRRRDHSSSSRSRGRLLTDGSDTTRPIVYTR
ncbi:uncharacterized protein LOC144209727 isoform X2 [Stigmatopora nigra]